MDMNQKAINLLAELSGKEKVNAEDGLQDDLGLDSLGLVTLLLALEEEFSIELEESDMNPFDLSTVADVVRLLEKYIEGPHE